MNTSRFTILIILLILSNISFANDVIIKYIIKNREFKKPFENPGIFFNITDNSVRYNSFITGSISELNNHFIEYSDSVIRNDSNETIIVKHYKNIESKCYTLWDGFGHELLLSGISFDTVSAIVQPVDIEKNYRFYLNDSIPSPWFCKITFDKKHAYIGFFDSIAQFHGDINQPFKSLKTFDNNIENYLVYISKVYFERIKFFEDFLLHNYMPDELRYYALKEIQYCYYKNLIDPLLSFPNRLNEYSDTLINILKSISNDLDNEKLFSNIGFYKAVLFNYITRILFLQQKENYRNDLHLKECYAFCEKNLNGMIKDYTLACLTKEYILYEKEKFDTSIYRDFINQANDSVLKVNISTLYDQYVIAKPLTSSDVLLLKFENSEEKTVKLGDVINKDIIVIDCWATWCLPCIKEIPYLNKMYDTYKNKIQFVSISCDQSTSKWNSWLNINTRFNKRDIIQLHAQYSFDNLLFKKLSITKIPRYILINKEGKILNDAMPYPNNNLEFRKIIESYIEK